MKKYPKNSDTSYQVNPYDARRFHGSIFTVAGNLAALAFYSLFLKLSVDETIALIAFSILAALQLIICAVIGFNYNSKMWLISAVLIFLICCGVVVDLTI